MSFWEDSSPVVKVALIVGVLGILYFAAAFFGGFFPFSGSCTHTPEGATEEVDGCPEGSACVDGACVTQSRGL